MRVVVYEPDSTGHHFANLAHVMPALAELPCEPVLLTTPEAAASKQFAEHLRPHADRFVVDTSLNKHQPNRSLTAIRSNLVELGDAIKRIGADHFYVAYGDGFATGIGLARLLGRRYWGKEIGAEVLLMRGGYKYGEKTVKAHLRNLIAPQLISRAPFNRVHHFNPDDVDVLQAAGHGMAHRCRLMPDPIERLTPVSRLDARRSLGIPERGRYIGCAGLIDTRKGADLLVKAFAAARGRLSADDRLFLAGMVQPEVRKLIETELRTELDCQRVVLLDRFLTTAELNTAVAALDVVCTPYPTHLHSASIVIRAAAAQRPVLGTSIGWMEHMIREFSLGSTCDVTNLDTFAGAIVASLDAADDFVLTDAARRYAEFHSTDNFAAHWVLALRERLGAPARQPLLPWEWVLEALPR